ncbi:MAG TPA: MmgE/PrpD family protein [Terriglobia bacterium]|nr:MmgE/PrpD family protein [Terriglobia bacterium]
MSTTKQTATSVIADFIVSGSVSAEARKRAAMAILDTVGVILAGVPEPAAVLVRDTVTAVSAGPCSVLGTAIRTTADDAAFANGVAAHAHDYDDMCFVSLAHPSCALVPAALAAGELSGVSGRDVLDAYILGFELECRLGHVMNPRHYHERGWHCTSSIGTLGAAAAASRLLKLNADQTIHALGIAASCACGLKENLGSMVKPLHAGMAARNGLMSARLAKAGFVASMQAIEGPQGYLAVMDSENPPSALLAAVVDLGSRWEIIDTGITVKLYPSCAATHPPLDALLALKQRHALTTENVASVEVEADSMTPRLLIYEKPSTSLEAKFSMPFCAAAAIVDGYPSIETFEESHIREPRIQALLPRVTLRVDPSFDMAAPLSQARVTVKLTDGRVLAERADGARGYPGRVSDTELGKKFLACARRSMGEGNAARALEVVRNVESLRDVKVLMDTLVKSP